MTEHRFATIQLIMIVVIGLAATLLLLVVQRQQYALLEAGITLGATCLQGYGAWGQKNRRYLYLDTMGYTWYNKEEVTDDGENLLDD